LSSPYLRLLNLPETGVRRKAGRASGEALDEGVSFNHEKGTPYTFTTVRKFVVSLLRLNCSYSGLPHYTVPSVERTSSSSEVPAHLSCQKIRSPPQSSTSPVFLSPPSFPSPLPFDTQHRRTIIISILPWETTLKLLLLFQSYTASFHKNVSELFGLEGAFPFILGSKLKSESLFWVVR